MPIQGSCIYFPHYFIIFFYRKAKIFINTARGQFSQLKNASSRSKQQKLFSLPLLYLSADTQSHEAPCYYAGLKQHSGLEITTVKSVQLFSIIQAEKMPVNNNNNESNQGKTAKDFFITICSRVILGKTFHLNPDVRCYTKNPYQTPAQLSRSFFGANQQIELLFHSSGHRYSIFG